MQISGSIRCCFFKGAFMGSDSCPGRGAAFFMPLRRAGTVTGAGVWYDPGSAAHHCVLRCARETRHAAIFTYSNSPGLLSMPTFGGDIQLANLPGSLSGTISEETKSPSSAEGRYSFFTLAHSASERMMPFGVALTSRNSPIWR